MRCLFLEYWKLKLRKLYFGVCYCSMHGDFLHPFRLASAAAGRVVGDSHPPELHAMQGMRDE